MNDVLLFKCPFSGPKDYSCVLQVYLFELPYIFTQFFK